MRCTNIEQRGQSLIFGDQTGVGKGRQVAAMLRYGLLSGYLPIFFTDRYTLFSDMYRDCKALGVKDARPLVVNAGVSVVDFDQEEITETPDWSDDIWSPNEERSEAEQEAQIMNFYQKQYKTVYEAPKKKDLQEIISSRDMPRDRYDYLMISYSQLKDARRDSSRLDFLASLPSSGWIRSLIYMTLQEFLKGQRKAMNIVFPLAVKELLQNELDNESLSREGQCLARFEEEMLFLSPSKEEVQAFLDTIPLSPSLESMRICLEDYLMGRTEIIHSPNDLD